MRGRKKEPRGSRITVSAKVSEPVAAMIDEARGDVPRSQWLRELISRELRHDLNTVSIQAHVRDRCSHPRMRLTKGVCPDCSTYVTTR